MSRSLQYCWPMFVLFQIGVPYSLCVGFPSIFECSLVSLKQEPPIYLNNLDGTVRKERERESERERQFKVQGLGCQFQRERRAINMWDMLIRQSPVLVLMFTRVTLKQLGWWGGQLKRPDKRSSHMHYRVGRGGGQGSMLSSSAHPIPSTGPIPALHDPVRTGRWSASVIESSLEKTVTRKICCLTKAENPGSRSEANQASLVRIQAEHDPQL